MGYLSLDVLYTDGTRMESRANRYTFVWHKTVEKNKTRLESRIHAILEQIEEGIAQDNREKLLKADRESVKTLEENHLPELSEYESHLRTPGVRTDYSKTDPEATFMPMKEDHMKNGQLKPAYNL